MRLWACACVHVLYLAVSRKILLAYTSTMVCNNALMASKCMLMHVNVTQVGFAECVPLGLLQMVYALRVGKPELMGYKALHA